MATDTDDFDTAFAEAIQETAPVEGVEAKAAEADAVAKEMGTAEDPPADPAPAAADPAPEVQFPDPVLSEDDTKVVEAFEKDWEDIAPATKVIVGHAIAAMEAKFARTLSQIVGNIYADIEPLAKTYIKSENESFRGAVLKAHEDYDAMYPKLDAWIKAQPAYLQTGLLKAYNEGTAEEVIDLVGRYKKDVGVQPQASAPAVAQPNSQPAQPAAAAAAALAPVPTKRTTPKPAGDDPEDYDSAFDEAAAALSK